MLSEFDGTFAVAPAIVEVLILVVMEDALWSADIIGHVGTELLVLILVVMEDALWASKNNSKK